MPASSHLVLASSGSFLITPGLGLMVWTLVIFGVTMLLLRRLAFPRIRDALDRLLSGRTALVIAHRLSTIQHADRILVFHKGRLREQGAHQELLAQRGIYYRLYQLQYKEQELHGPPDARDAHHAAGAPPLPAPQPASD